MKVEDAHGISDVAISVREQRKISFYPTVVRFGTNWTDRTARASIFSHRPRAAQRPIGMNRT